MKTGKNFIKVFSIASFIGALFLLTLVSCSDSDDSSEDEAPYADLEFIGYWVAEYEIDEGGIMFIAEENHTLQFTKDGQYMYTCPSRMPRGKREPGWYVYDKQEHKMDCESYENKKRVIYVDYVNGDEAKFTIQSKRRYCENKWYSIICKKTPGGFYF